MNNIKAPSQRFTYVLAALLVIAAVFVYLIF